MRRCLEDDLSGQLISNVQVFKILAAMVTPQDKQQMIDLLNVSVLSKAETDRFRARYGISIEPKDYEDFYVDMLLYEDRFKKLIEVVSVRGSKLLPMTLFTKNKEPGLADYFMRGLPIEGIGDSIWEGVDSKKKACVKTFKEFLKYFYERLEAFREIYRQVLVADGVMARKSTRYKQEAYEEQTDAMGSRDDGGGKIRSDKHEPVGSSNRSEHGNNATAHIRKPTRKSNPTHAFYWE